VLSSTSVSRRVHLRQTVDVVEVAVAFVTVLLFQLISVKGLVVERLLVVDVFVVG
jgi:hypothetical protein